MCGTGGAINLPGMYAAFVGTTALPALTGDPHGHDVCIQIVDTATIEVYCQWWTRLSQAAGLALLRFSANKAGHT